MNTLKLMYFLSVIGAILFTIVGALLITCFFAIMFLMDGYAVEMANADTSNWIFLAIGILSLIIAIFKIFISVCLGRAMSNKKSTIVGELIYILGPYYLTKPPRKSPTPQSSPARSKTASVSSAATASTAPSYAAGSMKSIMGIGYDDEQKWTYRGELPYPLKEPVQDNA